MNTTVFRSFESIIKHKGKNMIEAAKRKRKSESDKEQYGDHIEALLEPLEPGNVVEAFLLGALDAMIYDLACSADFTKAKGKRADYSGYPLRKKLIQEILAH